MRSEADNPIAAFVNRQRVIVLDGGLATALEADGFDLDDELWSARVLLEEPEAIHRVHLEYLAAGADCITTSSYQASLAGFRRRGLTDAEGRDLLRLSVRVAIEARDRFWSDPGNRRGRLRPLVAASVGPYGAFLADGSEYSGRYGLGEDDLYGFHRERWDLLADSEADLLACETIPARREAEALLRLCRERPERHAWMSFSCGDGQRLCDGSPMVDAARACDREPGVVAVGINCTAPEFIPSLIGAARSGTGKPIFVYPNSGERFDAVGQVWTGAASPVDWTTAAIEWARLGAAGIGGCCRIGPAAITAIRRSVLDPSSGGSSRGPGDESNQEAGK